MANAQTTTEPLLSAAHALSLVSGWFREEWANTSIDNVSITRLTNGLINNLQLVRRNNSAILEPAAVLIRHFGHAEEISELESCEDPEGDSVTLSATDQSIVFWEMGPRDWGPKLYGFFDGGRLEEYIDAHMLNASECTQPAIARDVARSYARIHSLRLAFPRDSFQVVKQEFIVNIREKREAVLQALSVVADRRAREYAAIFRETDWTHELEWVAEMFEKHDCEETMTHGDSNHLSVLVKNYESECQVMLIDYETFSWSYRGFDIGGHFNERMYCYIDPDTQLTGYPAPTLQEQRFWCEAYLQEMEDLEQDITEYDTVDHLILEASIGRLYHLLFTNLVCTVHDGVEMDPLFLSGLTHMMRLYKQLKAQFIDGRDRTSIGTFGADIGTM
ncbi:hypothetical protein LTR78_004672 [Recurvomyces mirabilis]|uniref:Choline/ethanolamine kinase n=1 Tax=Recurvomyces mirabilis TaxID=574656 RepID=A0AAE0WPP0_9PEZI|nr:hypothetical protein LTR78_004672 [Recurvomyces mirabilis]KAK5152835.1 hypothetical protein LTS14_007942 [Recurvomyces mirabilis]